MDILIHKIFLFLRNVSEYLIVSITFLLVTPLVLKYLPPIVSGVRVSSMFESSISFIDSWERTSNAESLFSES